MRIFFGVATVLLLAGCSTPSDLMAQKPVSTQVSQKLPKALALCVYPAWQDYRSNAVMNETTSGFRIVAGSDTGQTDDVLDIVLSDQRNGSIIKHYQRASWSQIGRGGLSSALNRCL
ncbi:hypothetical protein C9382_12555 [Pseudomonas aylmerensis]|uniref:Lipoprotein n=1 Tax=Pseudomonas aylmerensis TaxID=1869229 RepID=A0A2T4G104_9PSED|nr:hypothetical protein [Pseudomonas aylmerensis]PTC29368.1 hypothetical protein C9382_12555 [Pseudomonas aylmerensis]